MLIGMLLSLTITASAQQNSVAAELPAASQMETILVSGEMPGPGLWKVSRDEHVMWVLGTLSPVPKKMYWQSDRIEAVIAESQEVLFGSMVTVSSGRGFFGNLALLPAALGARKNPDKETLRDLLPAELYARWLVLKARYMGSDNAVEKRRPIFAAFELYEDAIKKSGLTRETPTGKIVERAAKRAKVPITRPLVKITMKDPKGVLKDFKKSALDDVECFALTMRHLEADLETMKDRANAWALGDIELLQSLSYTDQGRICITAMLEAPALEGEDFANLPERADAEWLKAAEAAIIKNQASFAVLPMRELIDADGLLGKLGQRGYRVESPTQQDAAQSTSETELE